MKFCIDSMYGAGGTILADIFTRIGVDHVQIRSNPDPLFPGINPEPIEPNIRALGEAIVANACQAGLCTDGDADRIGATDEHGNFVDPHKIYSVLLSWVLKYKGWPGAVTRAFNTTKMLDRIARKYGRELIEHGIGFKFVCDLMLEREILMGGEESGGIGFQRHLPERDGLLNSLLLANVMAQEKKTLGHSSPISRPSTASTSTAASTSTSPTSRRTPSSPAPTPSSPATLSSPACPSFARRISTASSFISTIPKPQPSPRPPKPGCLLRASGTEPLLRIYTESCSKESVAKLLDSARAFALDS